MRKIAIFLFWGAFLSNCCLSMGAEKQFRNSIDWGTGLSMGPVGMYEYPGESVFAKGIDFSMRYTRFIDDNWGVFLEGDISYNSASRKSYFGKLDRLDGGRYTYSLFKLGNSTQGRFVSGAYVGGVYRHDINRWSFRPRVGFGMAGYQYQRNRYYRKETGGDSSSPQAILILPSYEEGIGAFYTIPAGKIGLQTNYFVTERFFLALDLDFTIFMSHHVYRQKVYNTEKKENNAAEIILTLGLAENYRRTDLVSSTRINTSTPPMGAMRFTIGWDF